jgi:outer membrane autotransporter protein
LYGKYFWSRQEGTSVRLHTGDPVSFEASDSHRARGGARFSHALNERLAAYVGAAYEHEFDGGARATVHGYDIPKPDLTGDTGIGELGLSLKPSPDFPLLLDLGVQGYTGKREGVTGSFMLRFEF